MAKLNECAHPKCNNPFGMSRQRFKRKHFCSSKCKDNYKLHYYSESQILVFIQKLWRLSRTRSQTEVPQRQVSLRSR